ncbi:MAG: ImmA/IrrE family metallo-endopeptidase [Neptuniibacter sp.]
MNKIRANQIAKKALQTRMKYLGAKPSEPICPYNLAEAMGLDVRFIKISSFEGMYLAEDLVILIGAERPEGRKVFTCAHEIGHHILEHGTVIDEIIETGSDKEIEREADFFGSMLLMPESLIRRVGNELKIDFSNPNVEKLYIASRYIGVSFVGLITHLYLNMKLLSRANYTALKKINLGAIKNALAGERVFGEVFFVGNWWNDKAVDLCVGDQILTNEKLEIEGKSVSQITNNSSSYRCLAVEPGLSKITKDNGLSYFVRVSRKHFSGMNQYKFEEDVE